MGDALAGRDGFQRRQIGAAQRLVGGNVQDVPDAGVFSAQPVDCKTAHMTLPRRSQLVEKGDRVEEPDGVDRAPVLIDEMRVGCGGMKFAGGLRRTAGAAHHVLKADVLGLFLALGPVVAVGSLGNDPLFGLAVAVDQGGEPAVEKLA